MDALPPRRSAAHLAVFQELCEHGLDGAARDGEADALNARIRGHHFHVRNADDLPEHIEQRPAGIALVEGGVGLQQSHAAAVIADIPLDGGDDAVCEREAEVLAERIADRRHPVAHGKAVAQAELGRLQPLCFDLQEGNIADTVGSDELCVDLRFVAESHSGAVTAVNDMGIRQNEAVLRQHDSRPPGITDLAVRIAENSHDRAAAV